MTLYFRARSKAKVYSLMQANPSLAEVGEQLEQVPRYRMVANDLAEEAARIFCEEKILSAHPTKSFSNRRDLLKTAGVLLPAMISLGMPQPSLASSCTAAVCTIPGATTAFCFPAGTPFSTVCACLNRSGTSVNVLIGTPVGACSPSGASPNSIDCTSGSVFSNRCIGV